MTQRLLWASTGTKNPAYRDVLFLYSLARDLLDREPLASGNVDVLLILGGNPAYTAPAGMNLAEAIQNVKAADAGITAITSLIEAAKGLTEAALGTSNTADQSSFAAQFNQLRSQIDTLASDSGYRGTNLLTGDSLSVKFNETGSASLSVTGFTATASGLNIASGTNNWSSTSDITTAQGNLQSASDKLRIESKNLANNLNIITTRQNFTDSMIGTLRTGADNLTLADMNEEGANMLMLQTRQNLGITSLSMASQAAQAVLRLF